MMRTPAEQKLKERRLGMVEKMDLLDGRQPDLGLFGEIVVKPGRSGLLRADAKEMGKHTIVVLLRDVMKKS
jgi:hypothetical protein